MANLDALDARDTLVMAGAISAALGGTPEQLAGLVFAATGDGRQAQRTHLAASAAKAAGKHRG